MKLICDCGNEVEFKGDGSKDNFESEHVSQDRSKFEIIGEHDEVWITCSKCKKSIHMFT